MNIQHLKLLIQIIQIKLQILILRKKLTCPDLPNPSKVVIHHEAGNNGFDIVNDWHKKRWGFKSSLGFYCGYHYYISKSGTIHQSRRDNEEAAHTVETGRPHYWNRNSIGVCLQGDFTYEQPTKAQIDALRGLLYKFWQKYFITKKDIMTHKEIFPTKCPGENLQKIIREYRK